jgi:biopolymer transport protein ExbD
MHGRHQHHAVYRRTARLADHFYHISRGVGPARISEGSSPSPKVVSDPPLEAHQILVEVTATDRVSVDGKVIQFAQLYQIMAATIAFHDRHGYSRRIALYADTNASYNAVIKILDAARQAGDENVGFMVQ